MKEARVYGYARVSTKHQRVERQIDNIKALYPDAVIISEAYTGTKMDRPNWSKLEKQLREGDTVVFDEVSRMSRNAEEGFRVYKELYLRGVNLIFIKEATLNTENFRNATSKTVSAQVDTGSGAIDKYVNGNFELLNELLMGLAEEQIKKAFETAQHEVDFLHKRVKEGVRKAQASGKRVGIAKGQKLTTKKQLRALDEIRKYSKDFDGHNSDKEVIQITGLSRNTYYKYKALIKEELGLE